MDDYLGLNSEDYVYNNELQDAPPIHRPIPTAALSAKRKFRQRNNKTRTEINKDTNDIVSNTPNNVLETNDVTSATDYALKVRNAVRKKTFISSSNEKKQEVTKPSGLQRFNHLREDVFDMDKLTERDVASLLRERVIYEDDKILCINKPYGLPVHGGPGMVWSVMGVAQRLVKAVTHGGVGPPIKLSLCHRLDRQTTGVVVLAKNNDICFQIRQMFIERSILKTYWAIVCGVSIDSEEGTIDIPIGESKARDGLDRLVLKPDILNDAGKVLKRARHASPAVTDYRVLSGSPGAYMLEFRPHTGVKHQIRLHAAWGLGCPVLGDHKYSHHDKLAPQQLSAPLYKALGIRKAQTRYLPMHLHARKLVIPRYFGTKDLIIEAKAPKFHIRNMQRLKLRF